MKTFKYRIYGNQSTIANAENWLSACRTLYNLCLEQKIYAYKNHKQNISRFTQDKQLTEIRKDFPMFGDVNRNVLGDVLQRLDHAYEAFFRRIKAGEKAGFPRFKGVDRYHSFTLRDNGFRLKGKYINIISVGTFKIKLSRPIEGKIKRIIIKRSPSNKWFVHFICDGIDTKPLPITGNSVGIDMGCDSFLTDNNGNKIDNPRFFKKSEEALARINKSMDRKKKGSTRRYKTKILRAKIYEKIKNQREDFHHKVANNLLKNNDTIYVEKLVSWNSYRSLNRSMRDVSWFNFFAILKVKAESAGRRIVEVNPKNTSQICSACGAMVKKDLACRIHKCSCGLIIDRDVNAARNIYRIGQIRQSVSSKTENLRKQDVNYQKDKLIKTRGELLI
jgi:putative transposase